MQTHQRRPNGRASSEPSGGREGGSSASSGSMKRSNVNCIYASISFCHIFSSRYLSISLFLLSLPSQSIYLSICESIFLPMYLFPFPKSLTSRVQHFAYTSCAVCGSSHHIYFSHFCPLFLFLFSLISAFTSCFVFARTNSPLP